MFYLSAFRYLNYVQRRLTKITQYEYFHLNCSVHRSGFLSYPVYTTNGIDNGNGNDRRAAHIRHMDKSKESV